MSFLNAKLGFNTHSNYNLVQNAKCKMQNFGASPITYHRFKRRRGNSRIARIGIMRKLPRNQLKQLAPLVRGAVFCEAKRLRGSYIFKLFCISPSVIFFENATFLVRGRQRLIYNLAVTFQNVSQKNRRVILEQSEESRWCIFFIRFYSLPF